MVTIYFSEDDYPPDIFERTSTTMGLPPTYNKLAWILTTARKSDSPMRFLTSDDIRAIFPAVREAQEIQAKGKGKKAKVAVEIRNLVCLSSSITTAF